MMLSLLVAVATIALEPIPDTVVDALRAVAPDPVPDAITRDTHYLSSNEWRLETFAPALKGLGGTLVGVGADQNYLLAGWTGSSLLVLMDFDQWVVDLHELDGIAFAMADTPEAFIAFWARNARRSSEARIRQSVSSPKRAQRLIALFRSARVRVLTRLEKVRDTLTRRQVASFLTDQAQYDHIASLWRSGRVVAVRGDLTVNGTLEHIAAVLEKAHLDVRVLYTSNAEQYFPYSARFRTNVASLPVSGASLLLRTRPTGPDYTYCVQTLAAFREQLKRPEVRTVRDLAPRRVLSFRHALYEIPVDPPMSKPKKKSARAPRTALR